MWLLWSLIGPAVALGVVVVGAIVLAKRNRAPGVAPQERLRRRFIRGEIDGATFERECRTRRKG